MIKTGRTEGIYLKVKPEIKKLIEEKRINEDFNTSEYFEKIFTSDSQPDIEKIKEQKNHFLELVKVCDNRIANIKKEELAAEKLILNPTQIRQLIIACDPRFLLRKQYSLFSNASKKNITKEEFIQLKNKYLNKLYM